MGNDDLDKIKEPLFESKSDEKAFQERDIFERDENLKKETTRDITEARIEKVLAENDRFKEDTLLRSLLAKFFAMIIALWLLAVVLILVGNKVNNYNLSDNVLITLLTTTSINVIGMMLIILNNLFPNSSKKSELSENKKINNSIKNKKSKKPKL